MKDRDDYIASQLSNVGKRLKQIRKQRGYTNYEQFAFDHKIGRAQYGAMRKAATCDSVVSLSCYSLWKLILSNSFRKDLRSKKTRFQNSFSFRSPFGAKKPLLIIEGTAEEKSKRDSKTYSSPDRRSQKGKRRSRAIGDLDPSCWSRIFHISAENHLRLSLTLDI